MQQHPHDLLHPLLSPPRPRCPPRRALLRRRARHRGRRHSPRRLPKPSRRRQRERRSQHRSHSLAHRRRLPRRHHLLPPLERRPPCEHENATRSLPSRHSICSNSRCRPHRTINPDHHIRVVNRPVRSVSRHCRIRPNIRCNTRCRSTVPPVPLPVPPVPSVLLPVPSVPVASHPAQ